MYLPSFLITAFPHIEHGVERDGDGQGVAAADDVGELGDGELYDGEDDHAGCEERAEGGEGGEFRGRIVAVDFEGCVVEFAGGGLIRGGLCVGGGHLTRRS